VTTPRAFPGAVLACLLVAVSAPAGADQGPLFTLPAGAVFELDATGSSTEVSIPILASSELQQADTLQPPELFSVALANRYDGTFKKALTLAYASTQGGALPTALTVTVDLEKLGDPGTYSVVVGTRVVRATETILRTLSFQLVRPAAALTAALGPIPLDYEVGFSAGPAKVPVSLELRETTRRARVADMAIKGTGVAVEAQQGTSAPALSVDAGGLKTIPLALSVPGEVGRSTGRLWVDAPQLSAPVEVAYEVNVRRPRWHILFVVFIGLMFGNIVRVLLKGRIEDGAARSESLNQRRKLLEEQARYLDQDYRAELTRILGVLADAEKLSAADIKAALSQANKELTTAQAALASRTQEAVASGEALKKLAGGRVYSLPSTLAQAVHDALAAVEDAQKRIALDPTGAKASLGKAKEAFEKALYEDGPAWKRHLIEALDTLMNSSLPWPAPMADKLKPVVEDVKGAVSSITNDPKVLPPDQLLQAVHVSVEKLRGFSAGLWSGISPIVREVLDTLRAGRKDPASLERLQEVLAALKQRWTGDVEPDELAKNLPQDARQILTALIEAIRANTKPETKEQTEQLLAQRDYIQAATQAVTEQTALGLVDERMRAAGTLFPSGLGATMPRLEPQAFTAPEPRLFTSVEQIEARTRKQLWKDQLLQKGLLAVALSLGAYIVFEKSFVGTVNDYAALLFWAFGTDVTVDAVTALSASRKKPAN
jgi:hypothetical protein